MKLFASGINPVDTYIRNGSYAALPQLPYTPGKDGAGIVEKIAPGVTNVKVGFIPWYRGCNENRIGE